MTRSLPLFLLALSTHLAVVSTRLAADTPAPLGKHLGGVLSSMTATDSAVIFIYLDDKGGARIGDKSPGRPGAGIFSATDLVSTRSMARRARALGAGAEVGESDLPVHTHYIEQIATSVIRVRHALRWFNAVSAVATRAQIEALRSLPFVREIELVGSWHATPLPAPDQDEDSQRPTPVKFSGKDLDRSMAEPGSPPTDSPESEAALLLDYGASFTQVNQIGITAAHNLGIFGEGVMIGVFDNGFRLLSHEAFASMEIVAQYDFVDKKTSVIPSNPSLGFGSHGVNTLSTIGGYSPGFLIGPAFKSTYVLARTENDSSETPVEEDYWAAAIEWADSIGIDVASTSLGYLTYDSPWPDWSSANMDGNTTVITRAADHAVSLGIVVVNSAGNAGSGAGTNTLGAPADGDSVIAAGAVTSAGVRASFSSVGPTTDTPPRIKPDVMAMGVGVRVASGQFATGYGSANGTSFACPLTAGVAALILSANPTLGAMQVRDAMRNTADRAGSPDNQYGYGLLNLGSALVVTGIVPMAKVSGRVFTDVNGSGDFDAGDSAWAGAVVHLGGADSAITDGSGLFEGGGLFPGSRVISTDLPTGWIQTTPAESLAFTLLHRDTLGGREIGMFLPGIASGIVFEDADQNGVRDTGEAAMTDWTVTLSGSPSGDLVAVADTNGFYSFDSIPVGSYSISLTPEDGWVQSAPEPTGLYEFTVESGFAGTGLDFGVYFAGASAYPVHAGWNLLSYPFEGAGAQADSVYPAAVTPLWTFDTAYTETDPVPAGRGYWVKFPAAKNVLLAGTGRFSDTITLAPGWNLIGVLSEPVAVSSVVTEPDSLLASRFFRYTGTAYQALEPDSSLLPHSGYWVKSAGAGSLILDLAADASGPAVWVVLEVSGGIQCDAVLFTPPDHEEILRDAGVEVLEVDVEHYAITAVCGAFQYMADHYALIPAGQLPIAKALGFRLADR